MSDEIKHDSDEEEVHRKGLGMWREPGFPHKGWEEVDVIELDGDLTETCEVCKTAEIHFVHLLRHAEYSGEDEWHVGCVCAEHLTGDYVGPRRAEARTRNTAVRRRNFCDLAGWGINEAGTLWIRKGEWLVTVYPNRHGTFGASVWRPDKEKKSTPSQNFYETADAAKLAAFDHVSKKLGGGL